MRACVLHVGLGRVRACTSPVRPPALHVARVLGLHGSGLGGLVLTGAKTNTMDKDRPPLLSTLCASSVEWHLKKVVYMLISISDADCAVQFVGPEKEEAAMKEI